MAALVNTVGAGVISLADKNYKIGEAAAVGATGVGLLTFCIHLAEILMAREESEVSLSRKAGKIFLKATAIPLLGNLIGWAILDAAGGLTMTPTQLLLSLLAGIGISNVAAPVLCSCCFFWHAANSPEDDSFYEFGPRV